VRVRLPLAGAALLVALFIVLLDSTATDGTVFAVLWLAIALFLYAVMDYLDRGS